MSSLNIHPKDLKRFMDDKRRCARGEGRNLIPTQEHFATVLSVYLNYRASNPYGKKTQETS